MTDAPKHPESVSRREMIAATAAALVTPLLPGVPATPPAAVSVPGKFLTAAEFAMLLSPGNDPVAAANRAS